MGGRRPGKAGEDNLLALGLDGDERLRLIAREQGGEASAPVGGGEVEDQPPLMLQPEGDARAEGRGGG